MTDEQPQEKQDIKTEGKQYFVQVPSIAKFELTPYELVLYMHYVWRGGAGYLFGLLYWIVPAMLIDLEKVRHAKLLEKPKQVRYNPDGTGFISFTLDELRACACIANLKAS